MKLAQDVYSGKLAYSSSIVGYFRIFSYIQRILEIYGFPAA